MSIYKLIAGIFLLVCVIIVLLLRLKRNKWFHEHCENTKIDGILGTKVVDIYYIVLSTILIMLAILMLMNKI